MRLRGWIISQSLFRNGTLWGLNFYLVTISRSPQGKPLYFRGFRLKFRGKVTITHVWHESPNTIKACLNNMYLSMSLMSYVFILFDQFCSTFHNKMQMKSVLVFFSISLCSVAYLGLKGLINKNFLL